MTLTLTDPAEIDLARALNDRIGPDAAAEIWPLVRDAVLVCRCNGTDRYHTRGDRDWCVHRPGGPVEQHAAHEKARREVTSRG